MKCTISLWLFQLNGLLKFDCLILISQIRLSFLSAAYCDGKVSNPKVRGGDDNTMAGTLWGPQQNTKATLCHFMQEICLWGHLSRHHPCDGCSDLRIAVSKQCKEISKCYLWDPCLLLCTQICLESIRTSISQIFQSPFSFITKIALSGVSVMEVDSIFGCPNF